MRNPITLDGLRALDAIARRGSFAGAADDLNKVQSAVSYTITKLEEDLGVRLFDRAGTRAVLTEAGQLTLEEGRRLLSAADALADAARGADAGVARHVRLVLDDLIPFEAFAPVLKAFEARFPETELTVYQEVLGGALERLREAGADLVIGLPFRPHDRDLSARKIGPVAFGFYAAPDHPAALLPGPIAPDHLRAFTQVVVMDSARLASPRSAGLIGETRVLTVASMTAKLEAQAAGLGIGFLPRLRAEPAVKAGRLVELAVAQARLEEVLYCAWPKKRPGKACRFLIDAICSAEGLHFSEH